MANTVLAKMAVQISANTAEFNKALTKTSKDISSFTSSIKNVAGTIGLAFGVQQIAGFVLEISKLAGEAEGVENAFNRLDNSKQLLLDLKEATNGTVSELNLMKRSVQFSNFGLELSKLPTLLEFATKRAQATGQSVDYLVDSIVTGLGRKSVLILDNLGISAIALREEMAKVGDITVAVSNIIERDVANSGGIIETVALRTERLAANWDNFKVSIGKAANDTGILGQALEGLNNTLIVLGSETLSAAEKLVFFTGNAAQKSAVLMTHYAKEVAEANKQTQRLALVNKNAAEAFEKYNGNLDEFVKHITPGHKNTELLVEAFKKLIQAQKEEVNLQGTLQGALDEQAVLQKQKLTLTGTELAQTNVRLQQLAEEIKLLNELGLAKGKVDNLTTTQRKNFEAPLELRKMGSAIGTLGLPTPEQMMDQVNATIEALKLLPIKFRPIAKEIVDISGLISGGIADIANSIGEAAATGGRDFGKNILRSIAGFAQQFGAILIATGIGAKAFKSFSPAAMIGAGAALIALGGAVKATIANRPNLGGGGSGGGNFPSRGTTTNETFQNLSLSTSVSGTEFNVLLGNTAISDSYVKPKWRR